MREIFFSQKNSLTFFNESVTNGRTDRRTDQPTDRPSYRDARSHLTKISNFDPLSDFIRRLADLRIVQIYEKKSEEVTQMSHFLILAIQKINLIAQSVLELSHREI